MGLLLLARLHGQPIGCGALKLHQRRRAELKRMWIGPAARGASVARRLLGELERTAREAGAVVLRLDTNRARSEAIALYKRSGYVEVKGVQRRTLCPHWFEKMLGKKTQSRESAIIATSRQGLVEDRSFADDHRLTTDPNFLENSCTARERNVNTTRAAHADALKIQEPRAIVG